MNIYIYGENMYVVNIYMLTALRCIHTVLRTYLHVWHWLILLSRMIGLKCDEGNQHTRYAKRMFAMGNSNVFVIILVGKMIAQSVRMMARMMAR